MNFAFFIFCFLVLCLILFLPMAVMYFIAKILNVPKVGKILSGGYFILFSILCISYIFEDEFFTKSDAKRLLARQSLTLLDDFKIEENKSYSGIGEYYHTFTLSISEKDKKRIIQEIRNSKDFKTSTDSIPNLYYNKFGTEAYYFGKREFQNYETDENYVRVLFEPANKEGYAPFYRIIYISKNKNKLIFEDIDN